MKNFTLVPFQTLFSARWARAGSWIVGLCLSVFSTTVFAQTTFRAHLAGQAEVPTVVTNAMGDIEATLTGNELVITGTFSGLGSDLRRTNDNMPFTHIHVGYAGQNGPIAINLVPVVDTDQRGGTFASGANIFTLTAEQVEALNQRRMYINVHSVNYPGGEIRGQLLPNATTYFAADLYGSNEVPSVLTNANGRLVMELTGNTLVVTGSFDGLESNYTASHLHNAFAGMNGGVQQALSPSLNENQRGGVYTAASNTYTLTAEQLALLNGRRLYANIHSTEHPGGAIRGQVVEMSDLVLRAHLSGANERPAVLTMANGELVLELKGDQLMVSGAFQDLVADYTASHLHIGFAGQNGGVVIPLVVALGAESRSGTYAPAANTFTLTAEQKANLLQRQLYANVHSSVYTGGEIRGQVVPVGNNFFNAYISGAQEVPTVVSLGQGGAIAEIRGDQLVLTGSFSDLSSDYTNSHIHVAPAGTSGGVVFPLVPTLAGNNRAGTFEPGSNTFTLDEAAMNNLRARKFYVNIHSAEHPAGEIRGQLLHEATTYFTSLLSGASETNPVNTPATGVVLAEVTGDKAILTGSFKELAADWNGGAHIHPGVAGRNGPVLFPLQATAAAGNRAGTFEAAQNQITLTAEQMMALQQRQYYVNVHTTGNPGGEIRGQLLPLAIHYFTATLRGVNEVPANTSPGTGGAKLEVNGNRLTLTGSFAGLETDYNAPSGAHIHLGAPGVNGGVQVPLNPTLAADLKAGIFEPANNSLTLTPAQLTDLLPALVGGNLYVNVHSTGRPAGELRGQLLPEINFFPTATTITSPAPGASLTVQGSRDDEFKAEWTAATDPNGNALAYVWQLAADENFTTILVNQNVGSNLAFTTTAGTVDDLLAAAGLPVGGTVTLYHRALASDGSLATPPATPAAVTITRGTVTGVREEVLRSFSYKVYPSPANAEAFVALEALKHGQANLVVTDLLGRRVLEQEVKIKSGHNSYTLDLSRQRAGLYTVQIAVDGQLLPVRKILKK